MCEYLDVAAFCPSLPPFYFAASYMEANQKHRDCKVLLCFSANSGSSARYTCNTRTILLLFASRRVVVPIFALHVCNTHAPL
mmetsp:Transcript_254/g.575  ORF Transcript_254/g.575 Transcript_254/m.575 type:complete len:82 (+) Transcript_254:1871-2116(+)